MKGQTSIETLFLLLVIITSTIFIMGLYSQTHDSTIGISIVRTEIGRLANSMDELVLIKKVSHNRLATGENIFIVFNCLVSFFTGGSFFGNVDATLFSSGSFISFE